MSANDATVAAPQVGARSSVRVSADTAVVSGLLVFLAALAAVSWRKWGTPEIDAGVDLTTASQLAHGAVLYDDVRYFYGPLGIYALAGVFKVFGTSLGAALGLGLVMTTAITGTFYALARQALRPLVAGLATAIVLAIGFSGTQFNFILPHTTSATFGLLLLLLELLLLTRGRPLAAGFVLGLACLTRPELAAAAWLVAGGWVVGTWRVEGRRVALGFALRLALPGAAIPIGVLATFASAAGTDRLLWENLWPRDFLRIAGFRAYREWTPFDLESVASTLARGAIYGGLLGGLTLTVARLRAVRGARRSVSPPIDVKRPLHLVTAAPAPAPAPLAVTLVRAVLPLAAVVVGLGLIVGAWKASGVFPDAFADVQEECKQLLLGMSVLPILSFVAFAVVAVRFLRREAAPLTGSWPLDLALAGAAALLCSRAYDQFTMSSAAPYYAAPAVLILALLHQRLADRFPGTRVAVLGALAAVAAGIALYNAVALYGDKGTVVHTAAGSYVGVDASAGAEQQVIDFLRSHTKPGDAVLSLPSDGGVYFFADRKPALYDLTALPGLLDTAADERAAIARLKADKVRFAVVAERDTSAFETGRFGTGYNRLLGAYFASGRVAARIGPRGVAEGGGTPTRSFTIYELPH